MLQLRHLIRELVNEGQTALLSSHQLDERQKIFSV
jgi:ABC-type multidrug transport system ATPase subunit